MSTERQLGARDRRDAARRREQAALERAARSEAGGDLGAARTQRAIAEMHAQAALAAEALRRADVALEGERIGEPAPKIRRVARPRPK